MSRDSLRDAFVAGWNAGRPGSTRLAEQAFTEWYTDVLTTLDRSPSEWIDWDGSADLPPGVEPDTLVEVQIAGDVDKDKAERWNWEHVGDRLYDITAYKVVRT